MSKQTEKSAKVTITKNEVIEQILSSDNCKLTKQDLQNLQLEDLVKVYDSITFVTKEKGTKVKGMNSLQVHVLNHVLNSKLTSLPQSDMIELIRLNNVSNYFELPVNFKPDNTQQINLQILLGHCKSNNDNDSASRQTQWLKRTIPFIKSHIIGKKDSSSLYNNDNVKYYFELENEVFKLVEKTS